MLDPSSERQYRDFSSVGRRRARGDRALQAAGHRFETGTLHSNKEPPVFGPAVLSYLPAGGVHGPAPKIAAIR